MIPDIIYCNYGDKKFIDIARAEGFLIGHNIQPKKIVDYKIDFADLNPNKLPTKEHYVSRLAIYKPSLATVMDWTKEEEFEEVMSWAEMASEHVESVIIIPKVIGGVHRIPAMVNGKEIRLGYSVPTKYSGTKVPFAEFGNRPVHLLGGDPIEQKRLTKVLNVKSVDGNLHMKMANKGTLVFDPEQSTPMGQWCTLNYFTKEFVGLETDRHLKAFELSCRNLMAFWRGERIEYAGRYDASKNRLFG